MNRKYGFWGDLESYTWKKLGVLSPTLPIAGSGFVVVAIIASVLTINNSVVGAGDPRELVERAARAGDYERARELLNYYNIKPLNDLATLVYPERVVEREIEKYERLLASYPGNRDIYLVLVELYKEIGKDEQATEYWETARVLDPNNEMFAK